MEFEWDEAKNRANRDKHGFDHRGVPGWQVNLVIAASIIGVLPVHWVFNRGRT